jgi:hypothetical protein
MPLDALAHEVRCVTWRNELRGRKSTKVPYAASGKRAKADDPSSWGTRVAAETQAGKIVNGQGGGIGIQLGDLGNDVHLAGIDLDSCLRERGVLAGWAAAILNIVQSYTEVSPSGHGLKLFFYVAGEDVRPFLDRIGAQHGQWGVRRDVPGEDARDHGPAIEVYLSNRYFTVTSNKWPSAPNELILLDGRNLDGLAALIPPGKSASSRGGNGADNSRRAVAFRKGAALRRAGKSFDETCVALRSDPETADWVQEKGDAFGGRESIRDYQPCRNCRGTQQPRHQHRAWRGLARNYRPSCPGQGMNWYPTPPPTTGPPPSNPSVPLSRPETVTILKFRRDRWFRSGFRLRCNVFHIMQVDELAPLFPAEVEDL